MHTASRHTAMHSPPISRMNYFDAFGESVPWQISKWSADTGQEDLLDQLLNQQIERGQPVQDWYDFSRMLFEPLMGLY
jgi:hypothetical protein